MDLVTVGFRSTAEGQGFRMAPRGLGGAAGKRPLLPESEEDRERARKVAFRGAPATLAERLGKARRAQQWDALLT